MKKILLAIVAISFIFTSNALSQEKAKSVEITGFAAGYSNTDDELDDGFGYGGQLAFNLTKRFGLEGYFALIPTEQTKGDKEDLDLLIYTGDLVINFLGDSFIPYLALSVGGSTQDAGEWREQEFTYGAGLGAKYFFIDKLALRGDVRDYIITDELQTNLVYSLGLTYRFGGKKATRRAAIREMDSDGDTVLDTADQCPDTPVGAHVDAVGCPKDSDGDTVLDGMDVCPTSPMGASVDSSGCENDADGDTVLDGIDSCPDTPTGASVDVKGCPSDSDGDTVVNSLDQCPDTAPGTAVNNVGCIVETAEVGDQDGDTVPDNIDKCPKSRPGVTVDASGCEVIEKSGWEIKGIKFRTGSSRIEKRSYPILADVVDILNANPNISVEIQGYTDSTGSLQANIRLSQTRAKAVFTFLVKQGVDKNRLTYKGYGPENPKASNDTEDGRAQNRRIEFKVIE